MELCVTTDFYDDLLRAGRHFEKEDLDAMMAYCASLGAKRHEWILDTIWNIYDEDGPVGYDLLAEACEASHRHGMRFDVVFKPFEGGIEKNRLPHGMPEPEGVPLLDEFDGLVHVVRRFVSDHSELRLARHPNDADPGGRIAAVRLIKKDDEPASFGLDDLSLLVSDRNGGFRPYDGPVTWSETLEWRRLFPYDDCPSRIVTLGDLELPENVRYLMIRCETRGGTFTNAVERLVELVNENGQVIPSTPSLRLEDTEAMWKRANQIADLGLTNYVRDPAVRAMLADRDGFFELCGGMRSFNSGWEDATLDQLGEVGVARGVAGHVVGGLNPVHPEVREDWLSHVRFCVDRDVDGVNFRSSSHNCAYQPWSCGFNPPTLEKMTDPDNTAEAARINGEAYTTFLREAAEVLHGAGKEIGVHVIGTMLHHDDRVANNVPTPRVFEWQWEVWVREFADYVEFRGAANLRPENIQKVSDRIGLVAREAGIPYIFQSTRKPAIFHFDGPFPSLENEMNWARSRPDIAVYNLYEIANFSGVDSDGNWRGSLDMVELARRSLKQ